METQTFATSDGRVEETNDLSHWLRLLGMPAEAAAVLADRLGPRPEERVRTICEAFPAHVGSDARGEVVLSALPRFGHVLRPGLHWQRQVSWNRSAPDPAAFAHPSYFRRKKLPFTFHNRKMEERLRVDSRFRAHVERRLGGTILALDGVDGTAGAAGVPVVRRSWRRRSETLPNLGPIASNLLSRVKTHGRDTWGRLLRGLGSTVGRGSAGGSRSKVFDDPNLTIEERMALVMMRVAEKKEEKIQGKLRSLSRKRPVTRRAYPGGGQDGGDRADAGERLIRHALSGVALPGAGLLGGLVGGPIGARLRAELGPVEPSKRSQQGLANDTENPRLPAQERPKTSAENLLGDQLQWLTRKVHGQLDTLSHATRPKDESRVGRVKKEMDSPTLIEADS